MKRKNKKQFLVTVDHQYAAFLMRGYEACCSLMDYELNEDAEDRIFGVAARGLYLTRGYEEHPDVKWCTHCPYCAAEVVIVHSGLREEVVSAPPAAKNKRLSKHFTLTLDYWDKRAVCEVSVSAPCCELMDHELGVNPREHLFRTPVGGLQVVGGYHETPADTKWCTCCPYCGANVVIIHEGPEDKVREFAKKLYGDDLSNTVAKVIFPEGVRDNP